MFQPGFRVFRMSNVENMRHEKTVVFEYCCLPVSGAGGKEVQRGTIRARIFQDRKLPRDRELPPGVTGDILSGPISVRDPQTFCSWDVNHRQCPIPATVQKAVISWK